MVEIVSNNCEVLRFQFLIHPRIVFFFVSLKPKWCSSVIVYQEQGQIVCAFLFCAFTSMKHSILCVKIRILHERQERTFNKYLFT